MKKIVLLTLCIFGFSLSSQAQNIADHALGLRLGDNDGFGTEISYQHGLSENNRLELDLGWRSRNDLDAFRLTGIYQWVWNLEGGFNWYAGAGGGLGSVDTGDDSDFFVLIAGDVGIEYDFDFPLLLSLDFRPEIGFSDYNDDLGFDIALGIRYQF
ncbi:hypothetical protein OQ279_02845 [Salinimicrobium sp. MT39]|uniref:Rhodanese domain-containing protein n=1 Tax=Salinimicrobium profundisediminis TaxID=2994553 RepID=A0A9X3HZL9_9FLAO|nr:hypothetical protein [Salinimicrobium profundisediminis]MCX2837080.1 hypothetical protein [Salinimicrobium profundisediminis]